MNAPVRSKSAASALPHTMGDAFGPVRREFNRLLDDLGRGLDAITDLRLSPAVDFIDAEDSVEIEIELPGLTREDVKIAIEGDTLTVSGHKGAEMERAGRHYRITERSFGEFSRAIRLPSSVDIGKVTATMKNGVLKVTAAKRPDAKAQTIEIRPA